jgi:hypothetical protein
MFCVSHAVAFGAVPFVMKTSPLSLVLYLTPAFRVCMFEAVYPRLVLVLWCIFLLYTQPFEAFVALYLLVLWGIFALASCDFASRFGPLLAIYAGIRSWRYMIIGMLECTG